MIDYDDPEFAGAGERLGEIEYEDFIAGGDPGFAWAMPDDEWDAISLNYTSGTTGDPKGVVYHHRGAYLLALGNVVTCGMGKHPVYLWTLPMFHCNGWCFPWSISIGAGTHVCLRYVRADAMYDALSRHKVTHLCGAPIVMSLLLNAPDAEKKLLPHEVQFFTAAAPPPEAVLRQMKEAGFNVTHLYGLTESYGPAVINDWHEEWNALEGAEYGAKKARQGVRYTTLEALDVMDPETVTPVPADGETHGRDHVPRQHRDEGLPQEPEIRRPRPSPAAGSTPAISASSIRTATSSSRTARRTSSSRAARTSPRSRSRTRSTSTRPCRRRPSSRNRTTNGARRPCAFVELEARPRWSSAEELIGWCRQKLAGYKIPRHIVFTELPKTSTGKVQKFKLREMAKAL